MVANNCNYGGQTMNTTDVCLDLLSQFETLGADVNVYDIFGICYGPDPNPQMYQTNAAK